MAELEGLERQAKYTHVLVVKVDDELWDALHAKARKTLLGAYVRNCLRKSLWPARFESKKRV
jgi:hypothetical protein